MHFLNNSIYRETSFYIIVSEEHDNLEMGYKQFMAEIYGDNILFTDGKIISSLLMLRLYCIHSDHKIMYGYKQNRKFTQYLYMYIKAAHLV